VLVTKSSFPDEDVLCEENVGRGEAGGLSFFIRLKKVVKSSLKRGRIPGEKLVAGEGKGDKDERMGRFHV